MRNVTYLPTQLHVSDTWLRVCKASRSPDDSLNVALQKMALKIWQASKDAKAVMPVLKVVR